MAILERLIDWLFPELALKRAKARLELQEALKPQRPHGDLPKAADPWLCDDRRQRQVEQGAEPREILEAIRRAR